MFFSKNIILYLKHKYIYIYLSDYYYCYTIVSFLLHLNISNLFYRFHFEHYGQQFDDIVSSMHPFYYCIGCKPGSFLLGLPPSQYGKPCPSRLSDIRSYFTNASLFRLTLIRSLAWCCVARCSVLRGEVSHVPFSLCSGPCSDFADSAWSLCSVGLSQLLIARTALTGPLPHGDFIFYFFSH